MGLDVKLEEKLTRTLKYKNIIKLTESAAVASSNKDKIAQTLLLLRSKAFILGYSCI